MDKIQNLLKKITARQIILLALSVALFIGVFFTVNWMVSTWCATALPGVAVTGCEGAQGEQFTQTGEQQSATTEEEAPPPAPTPMPEIPAVELPPAWDGASRVNILVIGLDYADWAEDRTGPARSDTMIVLTIDPQSKTAGMLSIPRDLWVNIPGFDYGKINTAYYLGDANKLPGGGPDLASRTVEHVLGVPIHYYAQIDFSTFIYMVDYIGGIDVYVEKKITIDPIGPGADDVVLPVGVKHLDGMRALAYARARNSKGGDVDRARRTQQVILAIRDKALNPNTFPVLMSNAPRLYQLAQQGIKTNMALDDALKMAVLMQQIPPENIKQGVINYDMVLLDDIMVNGENQSIFKPIPDKIRELRDTIFTAGGALSPAAKGNDLADLMRQEGATVIVRNGTYTQGLAIETGDYLKTLGVNILGTDNANEVPGVTKIIDHRGRPYALRFFVELFKITGGNQVVIKYDPTAPADIEIILGDDWAFNNPMP